MLEVAQTLFSLLVESPDDAVSPVRDGFVRQAVHLDVVLAVALDAFGNVADVLRGLAIVAGTAHEHVVFGTVNAIGREVRVIVVKVRTILSVKTFVKLVSFGIAGRETVAVFEAHHQVDVRPPVARLVVHHDGAARGVVRRVARHRLERAGVVVLADGPRTAQRVHGLARVGALETLRLENHAPRALVEQLRVGRRRQRRVVQRLALGTAEQVLAVLGAHRRDVTLGALVHDPAVGHEAVDLERLVRAGVEHVPAVRRLLHLGPALHLELERALETVAGDGVLQRLDVVVGH